MTKTIDLEEYRINKIKRQMIEEYSRWSIVGNYDVDESIYDSKIAELMYMNLDDDD